MRSIELLVRDYPHLTGKEILELQQKDKELDEKIREFNEKTGLIKKYR